MECYCYPRNVQDLLSANGVLENQFVSQLFSFGSMIENHPISAQDQTRRPQFGTKVLPGIFLGYSLYVGRIWKGDHLVADVEELRNLDASEIHARRLNAKEVLVPKQEMISYSRAQMEWLSWQQKVRKSEHPSQLEIHPIKEKLDVLSGGQIQHWMCCWKRRVDDSWNVDGDRMLSGPFDRFYPVLSIERKASNRIHMVGRGD